MNLSISDLFGQRGRNDTAGEAGKAHCYSLPLCTSEILPS